MKNDPEPPGAPALDDLDVRILEYLRVDSRRPFLEIARHLKVSGGTVHARVGRMKALGVIVGANIAIDYRALGFGLTAFVGIKLSRAGDAKRIQTNLIEIPEIVELHYTTGPYSLFAKIVTTSMDALFDVLSNRMQSFEGIQSTETFVVLQSPLVRDPALKPG